jgi:hypothetical protein
MPLNSFAPESFAAQSPGQRPPRSGGFMPCAARVTQTLKWVFFNVSFRKKAWSARRFLQEKRSQIATKQSLAPRGRIEEPFAVYFGPIAGSTQNETIFDFDTRTNQSLCGERIFAAFCLG